MNRTIIFAFVVLILSACDNSTTGEYELSEELKQKALAKKKALLEGDTLKIEQPLENKFLENESQKNSPKWLLKQVFKAAKSGDFSILSKLCDPIGELDTETQRLCDVENTPPAAQKDFVKYFENGKISSDAMINGDSATVQILFGYENNASALINFVKRDGTWYMSSFD
ncbi:MAG: hypothetical protein AB8B72_05140 [Crocinitomicaceae bacterium]